MSQETKRCFFGIKIPAISKFKNNLREITKSLDVKLIIVNPINYHFTIHFFGDITDDQINMINNHFIDFHFNSFNLELYGTGIIPKNNPMKARILYVNTLLGTDKLKNLVMNVQKNLADLGFDIKRQNFLPHITVARPKYGKDMNKLSNKWLELKNESFKIIKCENITLMSSVLTKSGPIYSDIANYH